MFLAANKRPSAEYKSFRQYDVCFGDFHVFSLDKDNCLTDFHAARQKSRSGFDSCSFSVNVSEVLRMHS